MVKSPHPAFIKLKSFCWNTCFYNLGGFHRWNLGEICQISQVKSTRFQGEICWISRVKSPTLHSSNWRVFAETLAFIILGGFHRWNLGEIHQISWLKSTRFQGEIPHPAFIKLKSFCWNTCFYNFGWISQVISGWNPPDFTGEICRISQISWNLPDFRVKSARFHGFHEIRRISWNPSDFTGEIRRISRISWNPPDFMVKSAGFHECELLGDDQV